MYDPFGNPAGMSGSTTMLLGFPGQYWDNETQLSQNWYRDYDPTIGRYIESDPVGLAGGIRDAFTMASGMNTYSDVANRVLNFIDLSGRNRFPCPSPFGSPYDAPPLSPGCSFYGQACMEHANDYYCSLAPLVCESTPNSPWATCVRKCLQANDKYCHENGGTDPNRVAGYHISCWLNFARNPSN